MSDAEIFTPALLHFVDKLLILRLGEVRVEMSVDVFLELAAGPEGAAFLFELQGAYAYRSGSGSAEDIRHKVF